jgi:ribonuclease HI
MKLKIYTDGGARGNPGPAAIGVVVYDAKGKRVESVSKYLGEATNNQAEYRALITGAELAKKLGADEVDFYVDSELIVKQLAGEYRVKNAGLKPLFQELREAVCDLERATFQHVPREKNKEADRLVNRALDAAE